MQNLSNPGEKGLWLRLGQIPVVPHTPNGICSMCTRLAVTSITLFLCGALCQPLEYQ